MEFNRVTNTTNKSQIVLPLNINLHEQDENDNTLLHLAVAKGDLNKIDKLIKRHPYLLETKNKFGSTPLHYATWFGKSAIVQYLMELGADVKTKDIYDQTLMHAAAWNDDLNLVSYFFEKGLSLEEKDQNGNTPLLSAAKNNHLTIVKFLILKGADIAVHDNEGNNIFMIAAKNGYLKIIDYIARQKKIDLSTIKDKNNNTLLHLAVLHYHDLGDSTDHLKLIKYLFYFQRLDLEAKNNDGITPLDLAMETEDNNLVENLLQLGAKIDPVELRSNVRVHQIPQTKPEELGQYVVKQNEDLLAANAILSEASSSQKKVKPLVKKPYHFSKLQEALVKDTFNMQGLNASLNSMANAAGFFQQHVQAPQTAVSPFNLSSIADGNMGMNHSNVSQDLIFAQALFKIPRKNDSSNVSQIEKRAQEDRIVESINNYEFNSTAKPF